MTAAPDPDRTSDKHKAKVRTHTPRPDELTQDVLEFISAVDDYKRRNMRSFLDDDEILQIFAGLGYTRSAEGDQALEDALTAFAAVRERYRVEEGRLFPTWSEVYQLLSELGYARTGTIG